MSRPKGLGSRHIRGEGQPPGPPWWGRPLGCLIALGFTLFWVVVAIAAVFAVLAGPGLIVDGIEKAVGQNLLTGLMGLFLTIVCFGSVVLAVARRDRWVDSPIKVLSSLVVVGLCGLLGVGMLVYALTQPGAESGF